jgi:isopenicillin N synthase-like dioxygenase
VVSEVFASSARFFARPQEEKDSLAWTTPQANRGYVVYGREKVTQSRDKASITALRNTNPDLKESMEIGREGVDGLPNHWPDHLDEEGKDFKRVMQDFFAMGKELHMKVMRAIALGMGLPETFFDDFTNSGDNNLRLLHYPPVSKEIFNKNPGQVRAGEHSDYGSVTLLFQDSRGGLQVRSPKDTFVDATPIPDTIVINAGDLLARWSNDIIKSTRHRVIEPPHPSMDDGTDTYPARYSVAYFCNPNMDRLIEALPGTYGEGVGEKKYEGINSGEYLVQRLTATY